MLVALSVAATLAVGAFGAPTSGQASVVDKVAESDVCKGCEWGVRYFEDVIANPDNQALMEGVLDQAVCTVLPGDAALKCTKFVNSTLRSAVRYVEDNLGPGKVCRPVCPDTHYSAIASPSPQHSSDGFECAFCEFIAVQMQTALRNGTEVQMLLKEAEQACEELPTDQFVTQCKQYVRTKGPIIVMLLEAMTPDQICETVGACSGAIAAALRATPVPDDVLRPLARAAVALGSANIASECPVITSGLGLRGGVSAMVTYKDSSEMCQICKIATAEARAEISQPEFQAAVVKYLKQLCKNTEDFEEQCRSYVEQYSPLIFSMLEQYMQPDLFCQMVKLCEPSPAPPGIVPPQPTLTSV